MSRTGAARGYAGIQRGLGKDPLWAEASDLEDLPPARVERLCHYFLTYELPPGRARAVSIGDADGRGHVERIVRGATADYEEAHGGASGGS